MKYEIITADTGLRLPPIDLTVLIKDLTYKIEKQILKTDSIDAVHALFEKLIYGYRETSPAFRIDAWTLQVDPEKKSFSINYGNQPIPQLMIREVAA